jgi:peptidoglycan/LPS O-acetylase OafA/YrhL
MVTARAYFYGIDLVRFSSALMVACFHVGYSSLKPGSRGAPLVDGSISFPEGRVFFWGWVGVEIFFVISGFVIANSANGSTPFRFLRSRMERLYPAVWICATVSAAVWLISGAEPVRDVVAEYLHTITLWPLGAWIDAPYWTIACEIVFYGFVFLLLLGRSFHRLEQFAIVVVIVSSLFWMLYLVVTLAHAAMPPLMTFFVSGAGNMLPIYYGPFFGLGMLMWVWRRKGLSTPGMVATIAALVFGVVETIGINAVSAALDEIYLGMLDLRRFVRPFVWLGAVVILFISSGYPASETMAPAKLRVLRSIGLATYPLYLLHFALGVWTLRLLTSSGFAALPSFVAVIACLCALSLVITIYGEPALRGFIRAALNRWEVILGGYGSLSSILHRNGGAVPARLLEAEAALGHRA